MSQKDIPAWLKSKDDFGQEVNVRPMTSDREVLINGRTNLEEEIDAIYNAIEDISLIPGPVGPQGLRGERGPKGLAVSDTEPDDPDIEVWINPTLDVSHIIDFDNYYQKPEVDMKFEDLETRFAPLEQQVDELLNPLQIKSFTCQPNLVEMGTILPNLTLSWSYSRDVKTQRLDGQEIDKALRSKVIEGLFESNRTFRIEGDGYSKSVSATASFSVMNRVYFGSAEPTDRIDQLIPRLSSELRQTRGKTFTTTCQAGQHIYYAYPARYGDASFMVGGFAGGFEKIATVEWTNGSKYTENFHVYRSVNQNLGVTTVTVS